MSMLLVRAGREQKGELPPPFDQVKFSTWGGPYYEKIYMAGNVNRAVEERTKKKPRRENK